MRYYLYVLLVTLINGHSMLCQSKHKLWYNGPATFFEETLVLGNGKMGASVFGGVQSDKIYLNDATLWSGEPEDPNMNPEGYKSIPLVRQALKEHDFKLADSLNKLTRGVFSESYAPLGTLHIQFNHQSNFKDYHRELDISNAISTVSYEADGIKFTREYFISHPDKIMAIKLSANQREAISCSIGFESLLKYQTTKLNKTLSINGYAPYHAEPSYMGDVHNAVVFDKERGTRFTSLIQVKNTGGKIVYSNNAIMIENCSEAIIYISTETSFNGFDKNPATEGRDNKTLALNQLNLATLKSYDNLKQDHLKDYMSFYNRVSLDLGKTDAPDIATNERLKRYSKGLEDRNLEILYFNYGRYLLISSSRTEGVPANLQGIWNPYLRPPWSSNYTMNINVEENYWLAEIANLSEMHHPLLSFIEGLAETGKVTAKNFYGVAGWAAHHNSDIWAMSNQVDDFGNDAPNTVIWNMGGVWLSTHLWEHYAFTRDTDFLKNKAYPLMKGAAQFCLEWMVKDQEGYWITSPGTSPENLYVTPRGYVGATSYGCTSDMGLIRELLTDLIKASKILKINDDFTKKLTEAYKNLLPYKISKKGHLQEWYYDWEDADPKHRHQSHLFGLHPGRQIHPVSTPQLAEACRQSLEIKGDETTGWSKGWRINLWARLWDGNRAYKMYRELLRYVDPNGLKTTFHAGGGTYPNLFDAHPPFQIDGNFGGAAAVIEMIMQSSEDKTYLLPALPDAWETGTINGICARSGFELSLKWKNKKLIESTILAKANGNTTLIYKNKKKTISLKKGESLKVNW